MGVTPVNGLAAEVYGNQFVINNVPLTDGDNRIIVNAIDSNGAVGRAELSVRADTSKPYITLSSNITSGIPALTTYFSVSTSIPNAITTYQIDFDGDGTIDYTGDNFDNITYTYTTEGIFYPTVTVTDDQGNSWTDSIAVTVLNKTQIDALLKGKWEGMKAKLISGDIEAALTYYSEISKQNYRDAFGSLNSKLGLIFGYPERLKLIDMSDGQAKYEYIVSEPDGSYSYPLIFERDSNGAWKILQY
ncbi:MAG TPA: PKD domain-containing protein [Thermodesulfovibrionales bacterium]|nr:PKD domain-containing protein [Thermodesulfovibrionales bacterium]